MWAVEPLLLTLEEREELERRLRSVPRRIGIVSGRRWCCSRLTGYLARRSPRRSGCRSSRCASSGSSSVTAASAGLMMGPGPGGRLFMGQRSVSC